MLLVAENEWNDLINLIMRWQKEIIETEKRSKTKFRLIFYTVCCSRNKYLFGWNTIGAAAAMGANTIVL